jgi:hypothetical protein
MTGTPDGFRDIAEDEEGATDEVEGVRDGVEGPARGVTLGLPGEFTRDVGVGAGGGRIEVFRAYGRVS